MTQIEKMELFIRAMKREVEIEYKSLGNWHLLTWKADNKRFHTKMNSWGIGELLADDIEIRIAKSLPLLSDADADFAEKYLPHDWWIARDDTKLLYVYNKKPYRNERGYWVEYDCTSLINSKLKFPKFEAIKWENDDCYTIQELLDYYKAHKEGK